MSEVPFLDSSCLGPDLTSLNEDDLLRYFLNDDFEQSPFDSKVPSSSPLLDPPAVTLVSPLPKQARTQQITTQPIQVKKETQQPTVNTKSNSRAKSKTPQAKPNPSTLIPIPSTITPVSLPIVTPSQLSKSFSTTTTTTTGGLNLNAKLPNKPIITTPINATPIPVTGIDINSAKSTTVSPGPSPLSSPSPSPSPILSPALSPVGDDDKSVKRQRRLLKNRESAQLSRIRKKMYIDELERKVNALVTENTGLREEVVHLNDVLKQVANGEGDSAKSTLTRTEIMRAITAGTGGSASQHAQAKKYAGVCLLVVLFSLGLFLNVASPNTARQSDRIIELDTHSSNKNNTSPFRDYKLANGETETVPMVGRKEKSEKSGEKYASQVSKRSWEGSDDEYDLSSPKRGRFEQEEESYDNAMDVESDGELFDVLEDDAFSDSGVLTLSSSTASSPGPASPVPFTPPAMATPTPSTPVQPGSPGQINATSSPQMGFAVIVPSSVATPLESSSDDGSGIIHIHLWSFVRSQM